MDAIARLAESKIRSGIARGEFDNLPGRGKPRKEAARLDALLAATGDAKERARLSRLRADAVLRYQVLANRRRRLI